MSALKRKQAPGGANPPAKSVKTSSAPQNKKRNAATPSVAATAAGKKANGFKDSANKVAEAPQKSILSSLREEEPLFPRGGASVLTPLEQKKIGLEAKADALREEDEEMLDEAPKKAAAAKKNKGRSRKNKDDKLEKDENAVKVEALNFKKVTKGSLVLAQITEVKPLGLTLDLPNNLSGTVAITYISDTLTQRLQASADASDSEENDDDDSSNVDLKQLFSVGQYVRAAVLSTKDGAGKSRRHIDLSLRPSDCNAGLTSEELVTNAMVMASVVSVEEKGCVMDLGIAGQDMRGFMPRKELDKSISEDRLQPGAVFFCQVVSKSGKVVQLTSQSTKISSVKNTPHDATTINTFVPGTVVDVLVGGTTWGGLYGKIMGSLDATADLIHSGVGPLSANLENKYKVASKVKARVLFTLTSATSQKVGVSLLPHILSLECKKIGGAVPTKTVPVSSFITDATVKHIETEMGLFADIGRAGFRGFAHISALSDEKIDALFENSGDYQLESKHKARVTGYNAMDGIFQLSLQPSVLARQYLRMEDVPVGAIVNCTVESVPVGPDGVTGVVAKVGPGIVGFITAKHLADVELQHPEKKFRPGVSLKARVLALDLDTRKLKLTLKKTLVNSDAPVVSSIAEASVGMRMPGTITKLLPNGAFIHFYGTLRGFLPVSQMSEALIKDPSEHFRVGQVVSVHVLDVDPEKRRLVVSCRDPSAFGVEKQAALKNLKIGEFVSGKVMEKAEDMAVLELAETGLKAFLPMGHLSDKSSAKNRALLKKLHVGQTISDLVVLEKHEHRRAITLTQKPSLSAAAKDGKLVQDVAEVKVGSTHTGFVGHITATAIFVHFAGKVTALLPKSRMPADIREEPSFGFELLQSVSVEVVSVNPEQGRPVVVIAGTKTEQKPKGDAAAAEMPKFEGIKGEFGFGTPLTAKITAVKATQANVQIVEASELQGRIDVSQLYDSVSDISNTKAPLSHLKKGDTIPVRVLGVHDARNHSYLPISHRYKAHQVLELTARPSDLAVDKPSPLAFGDVKVGVKYLAFINNSDNHGVWVSLAPNVRGRIAAIDLSDDMTLLNNIGANFPVGMALSVYVVSIDAERKLLSLSVRSDAERKEITWDSVKAGAVLPGRVTKVSDRQVLVKLSEEVSGPIHLPDLHDDFEQARPQSFKKNDLVRVSVVDIDRANKRVRLSARASRVIGSSSPVVDKEISEVSQLESGAIVRGFIKSVSDTGLFVLLGGNVTARVKISNMSDKYIKDWKASYQVDQLVKGRIVSLDAEAQRIELSLKESALDSKYVAPKSWSDLKEGMVLTGVVRKVEEYGAFIEVENADRVRGLCHRSEMAEQAVADARKLYNEGDRVKIKVLSLDLKKKRVNFGLKASYFEGEESDDEDEDVEMGGVALDNSDEEMEDAEDVEEDDEEDEDEDEDEEEDSEIDEAVAQTSGKKYDWAADPFAQSDSDSDSDSAVKKTKKAKKSAIQVDKTAKLDVNGPKTTADYEKLLLESPDDSDLWLEYMALPLQLGDMTKARDIAERAIKTVNVREETAKLNIWLGYINLEAEFGTKDRLEEVFKRACQYNDELEVHTRVASVYIQTQRLDQAEALFEAMSKKFGSQSPDVWSNYAHFLHATQGRPDRARALLRRALQSLKDPRTHLPLTVKFAALEFRSAHGDVERGRTFFAGILDANPKKGDLWSQLLDLELAHAVAAPDKADTQAIRDLFERRTKVAGLKPVPAQKWFERWAEWEARTDEAGRDKVMAKAKAWVVAYKTKQAAKKQKEEAEAEDVDMED